MDNAVVTHILMQALVRERCARSEEDYLYSRVATSRQRLPSAIASRIRALAAACCWNATQLGSRRPASRRATFG